MKKIQFLALLYLLLLCFTACDKDDAPSASFRVIDAATKEGIPNATVGLFEKESTGAFSSTIRTLVEVVETDEDGVYNFTYSRASNRTYDTSVDADTYWESTRNSYPRNRTIEMDPEGYVRVKVMKVDTTEYARINVNSTQGGSFSGTIIDTSFINIKRGNTTIDYTWFVYNNFGELTNRATGDEFYVVPHDTATFEIIF